MLNKKHNFLISIIIPYHSNHTQVQNLLDTVPDSKEIEVLLINDIYDASFLNYTRFTATKLTELYNTPPAKWAGASRNTGLRHCSGEFIIFADSDDTLITHNFLSLLEKLKTIDIFDYAVCSVTSIMEGSIEIGDRHLYLEEMIKKFIENGTKLSILRHFVVWSKVYSRNFLIYNNIKFEEVIASNDNVFSLKCWIYAKRTLFINILFYKTTQSANSLIMSSSKATTTSRVLELCKCNQLLISHGHENSILDINHRLQELRLTRPLYHVYIFSLAAYKGYPVGKGLRGLKLPLRIMNKIRRVLKERN